MTTTCLYFVLFGYHFPIELELQDYERIINVCHVGSYRQVWIEGTPETQETRFPKREEEEIANPVFGI